MSKFGRTYGRAAAGSKHKGWGCCGGGYCSWCTEGKLAKLRKGPRGDEWNVGDGLSGENGTERDANGTILTHEPLTERGEREDAEREARYRAEWAYELNWRRAEARLELDRLGRKWGELEAMRDLLEAKLLGLLEEQRVLSQEMDRHEDVLYFVTY